MAKVEHVKAARKDHPECGVKAGEPYYTWSLASGGRHQKRCSKNRPRASQTTSSEFWQAVFTIQESVEDQATPSYEEDFETILSDLRSDVEGLMDETRSKLDGLPENLQQGSATSDLLQGRIDGLESWIDAIDSFDIPREDDYTFDGELDEDGYGDAMSQALSDLAAIGADCD